MTWKISSIYPTLCLVILFAGCGGGVGDRPALGNVSGTVTLDGKPVANATVTFSPTEGRASKAVTDAQGYYSLQYTADASGAVVGQHVVAITTASEGHAVEGSDEWIEGTDESIPAKYNAESELTVTVKDGSQTHDFDLKSE